MNRRDFLKTIGVIGTVGLVGKPEAGEDFSGHPDRFGMLTDISLCIGCRRCEEACSQANNLPEGPCLDDKSVFDKKRRLDVKAYTVVNRYIIEGKEVFRKVQCFHCEEPACVSACLVGALKKTKEGPVIYNPNLCIGCRYCMVACPFYIPAYEYSNLLTPRVMKCQMCYDRIKEGKAPACAEVCLMEAITFGKKADLLKFARGRIVKRPDKYVNHIYGER
ncbi:MAG: 4Fe-4S dicluster domain-containing protein, partial [Candidatus Desantisbacteria bacterium]